MTDIRRMAFLCLLFVTFALIGGVSAAHRASAAEVLGTGEAPIRLEASKGTLIRLERAASTVFVADPEIADVQVKSPRLVYLMAKKPGETVVYAVDREERVLLNQRITVNHNLSRLRTHGFRARMKTKGGRKIVANRRRKGRKRLATSIWQK